MEFFSPQAKSSGMKAPKIESLLPLEMRSDRVGPRITAMREVLKLSKAQLADSIGLDRSALSRIEKGGEGLGLTKGMLIAEMYKFGLNYLYRADLSDVPQEMRAALLVELHRLRALPGIKRADTP